VDDYLGACGPRTAAFLRVHQSNFSMQGFVARPEVGELADAAHERGVLLLEDVGSGLIGPATKSVAAEDRLRASLGAGVDLLFCSGDKLLGGSQAGLLLGRRDLIDRLRRYPLARALRPDKLQLAVLEETLLRHATPGRRDEIPVLRMLGLSAEAVRGRAQGWSDLLGEAGLATEVVACEGAVGGGTTPGAALPSFGLLLRSRRPGRLRRRLLGGEPPVVALERPAGVVIDARCVLPGEDRALLAAVRAALEVQQ
jgi:L-seryl-tRNA(Ser) seleniumtransferase